MRTSRPTRGSTTRPDRSRVHPSSPSGQRRAGVRLECQIEDPQGRGVEAGVHQDADERAELEVSGGDVVVGGHPGDHAGHEQSEREARRASPVRAVRAQVVAGEERCPDEADHPDEHDERHHDALRRGPRRRRHARRLRPRADDEKDTGRPAVRGRFHADAEVRASGERPFPGRARVGEVARRPLGGHRRERRQIVPRRRRAPSSPARARASCRCRPRAARRETAEGALRCPGRDRACRRRLAGGSAGAMPTLSPLARQIARAVAIPEGQGGRRARRERRPPVRVAARARHPRWIVGRRRESVRAVGGLFGVPERADRSAPRDPRARPSASRAARDSRATSPEASSTNTAIEAEEHDGRGDRARERPRVGFARGDEHLGRRRLAGRERGRERIAARQRGRDRERRTPAAAADRARGSAG